MPFPFTLNDVIEEMARMAAEKKIAGECELCSATATITLLTPGTAEKAAVLCDACLRRCLGREL
jgi:hypothetical protein